MTYLLKIWHLLAKKHVDAVCETSNSANEENYFVPQKKFTGEIIIVKTKFKMCKYLCVFLSSKIFDVLF